MVFPAIFKILVAYAERLQPRAIISTFSSVKSPRPPSFPVLTSTIENTSLSLADLSGIPFKAFVICTLSFLYNSLNRSTSLAERKCNGITPSENGLVTTGRRTGSVSATVSKIFLCSLKKCKQVSPNTLKYTPNTVFEW